MKPATKHRLIGLIVVIALASIFLPVLLDQSAKRSHQVPVAKTIPIPRLAPAHLSSNVNRAKVSDQDIKKNNQAMNAVVQKLQQEAASHHSDFGDIHNTNGHAQHPVVSSAAIQHPAPVSHPAGSSAQSIGKHPAKHHVTRPVAKLSHIKVFSHPPTAWIIQLGTFRESKNAELLVKQLRSKGFDALTKSIVHKDGQRFTRVYVGPEPSIEAAHDLLSNIKKHFHVRGMVKRYHLP